MIIATIIIITAKHTIALKDKKKSQGNIIEDRQRMKVEESKEGKQKTKKEIETERKIRRYTKKVRRERQKAARKKVKDRQERQKEKVVEDMQRKTEEKGRKQNTGKERLKRVGSGKTIIKKCMLYLENKQQQRKEGRKRRK